MRYAVVATTGWLLLVDLQSRQVQPLENNRPEYYGISWFPHDRSLVLSHSGLNSADLIDIAAYAQSERGWLSCGERASREFLSAPHQIICAPDGRVICTNTGRNVVSVFDFSRPNVFQEEGIGPARWDRLALDQVTSDHLNSVFMKDERLYVIAHSHNKGSKLAIFAYPALEVMDVEPLGARTGLHNIWITKEGQRISCHSENGSLIDLDDQQPLWESGSAVYTRGLAVSKDHVLVGESQKSGRDLRRSSLTAIWILDRHKWQAIDYLALGPYGAVNEVRLLDVADEAHHGCTFSGLELLLSNNAYVDVQKQRLQLANAAAKVKHIWAKFESIFGSPEMLTDGAKKTAVDHLCLVIRKTSPNAPLVFAFSLEPQAGAHVSAVIGYNGQGADSTMAASLLQPVGDSASLSVWIHNGQSWSHLPEVQVHNLPHSGTLQLETTFQIATIMIDGEVVMSLNRETLGLERCDEGLGIRWSGATVRPKEVSA